MAKFNRNVTHKYKLSRSLECSNLETTSLSNQLIFNLGSKNITLKCINSFSKSNIYNS